MKKNFFFRFLTSSCTEVAQEKGQKTLTASHVLSALKNIDFENFIPPLEEQLEEFRKNNKEKGEKKANKKKEEEDATKNDGDTEQWLYFHTVFFKSLIILLLIKYNKLKKKN